jgi:hypothetical protein
VVYGKGPKDLEKKFIFLLLFHGQKLKAEKLFLSTFFSSSSLIFDCGEKKFYFLLKTFYLSEY